MSSEARYRALRRKAVERSRKRRGAKPGEPLTRVLACAGCGKEFRAVPGNDLCTDCDPPRAS